MAGLFHYLRFRAFAQATEDVEKVKAAMRTAAQSPKIEFEESRMEGTHGNSIVLLEGDVKANPIVRAVFSALWRDDPEGTARLVDEVPRRFDENLNLYFRLDKQEAFQGRCVLTPGDDAIHVRGKVRSVGAKQIPLPEDIAGFLREIQGRMRP